MRIVLMRALILTTLILGLSASADAQGKARIVGKILDANSGAPLAGAQVVLVENPLIASVAAIDGRYTLLNVPAGPVSVRVRFIGYQSKVVAGIVATDGGFITQDITLTGQALQAVIGVSLQDGKFVFVHVLGDRYTPPSLNGARVPSPQPARKVVPL